MSSLTAGSDIIPHIDIELDHTCTDTPSFIGHFRASTSPAQKFLYTNAFNMFQHRVVKRLFNDHLLVIF